MGEAALTDDAAVDDFVHHIASDWRAADLSPADAALCAYAEKLTHTPWKMTAADVAGLRAHGFDDRAIHDAVQVIGYFNYINRVADALGIEFEEFIRPWERSARPSASPEGWAPPDAEASPGGRPGYQRSP